MSALENGFENVAKMGRRFFELNNEALVKWVDLSAENFKKYLELNENYVSRLPEVNDLSSFVELQRDYGQHLWEGVQSDLRARGEILRETVEELGSVVRGTVEDTAAGAAQTAADAAQTAADAAQDVADAAGSGAQAA